MDTSILTTINDYLEASAELHTESTHTEIADKFKSLSVQIKELNSDYAKAFKAKDYKEAKKILDKIDDKIDEYSKAISNVDSSVFADICSVICQGVVSSLKATAVGIGAGILVGQFNADAGSAAAKGSYIASQVTDAIKIVVGIMKAVKDKGGNISASELNVYKGKILGTIEAMKKINDKKKDIVEEAMAKKVKESTNDIISAKLDVYEAFNNGKISEEEKEVFIEILK